MKSTKSVDLKQLEKSDCWSLFARHAFHGRNVSEYQNLESIGRNIVGKCGGLPLAVKQFSHCDWVKILDADMWHLSEGDSNINSALRLSYHNLSSNLKRCFAYCSIFPKGYVFNKDKLIKLWIQHFTMQFVFKSKIYEDVIILWLSSLRAS
ncbi:CC-NBS-LRR resistance protein [Trifolium pratense]|uniref:CC-NBS-LRR resistance protein n=1 Tax=Trifolium pratense TaxID=57577 RepID=A0A2K3LZA8_TRIPR|nr:CC-NBS-LRR resistance protein [Trifolium pratense]